MNKTKKYVTIAVVLLCVCAAVYLNWSYNTKTANADAALSDSEAAGDASVAEEVTSGESAGTEVSDYFASARLTRQQSRDEALSLLQAAAASSNASQETIDSATNAIAAMASYSMQETEIENILLAKNFAECVAFITGDGVTLAVPAPESGLSAENVAKITDAVTSETDFSATQIKIIEVKEGAVADTLTETTADDKDSSEEAAGSTSTPAAASSSPAAGTSGDSSAETAAESSDMLEQLRFFFIFSGNCGKILKTHFLTYIRPQGGTYEMPDNYISTVTERGNINISEDVIAVMVGAAIDEVEGVTGLANTVGNDILEFVGKKNLAKGVKVTLTDESITIDVLILVNFGCVITEVAGKVQTAVANALEAMTGLMPRVNVHVSGVTFPKSK